MKHPSGKSLVFEEKEHRYHVDGEEFTGATTFLKQFFPAFNAKRIAGFVAKKREVDTSVVLEEWDKTRDDACALGNAVHEFIEYMLGDESKGRCMAGEPDSIKRRITRAAVMLINLMPQFEVVAVELQVFSLKHNIAGTVDALFRHKETGEIHMYDWKTNKEILMKSKYYKKGLDPIKHMQDCNFSKYSLQLNLYKRILEEEGYFDKIHHMAIVHVTDHEYTEHKIPELHEEITNLLGAINDQTNT